MFLIVLAFCLSGYLLPWTQLSYWATTVVTSIPTAFPFIGDFVSRVLRGGEQVTGITLGRFFALHVSVLPPLFLSLMVLHIFFVKRTGLSTPPFGSSPEPQTPWTGYRRETHPDGHPFYPYFVRKEIFMSMLYLTVMFFFITFFPTLFLSEATNTPADPLRTPSQIRPEWYFLAPYQMLKLVPNKFIGITLQIMLVAVLLLWPFLDAKKEPNILKRPVLRTVFFLSLIVLAVLTIWGQYR
jgi:ubiquinol-cytochrome c reductase cytochrome b subunit